MIKSEKFAFKEEVIQVPNHVIFFRHHLFLNSLFSSVKFTVSLVALNLKLGFNSDAEFQ